MVVINKTITRDFIKVYKLFFFWKVKGVNSFRVFYQRGTISKVYLNKIIVKPYVNIVFHVSNWI